MERGVQCHHGELATRLAVGREKRKQKKPGAEGTGFLVGFDV
jgi:hypothetical protein